MKVKKPKIRKELREWIILLSVGSFLYFTGLHTVVIGTLQRGIVMTGVMQPSLDQKAEKASYQMSLEDVNGNLVSLEEMKGKPIFMNFWATWCPPCVAEMPDIHSLYQEMKDDVIFVMLSRDKDEQRAKDWIKKNNYEFPIYFLRSSLPREYQSRSIPTTYVISPAGEITVRKSGMAKYDTDDFKSYLRNL